MCLKSKNRVYRRERKKRNGRENEKKKEVCQKSKNNVYRREGIKTKEGKREGNRKEVNERLSVTVSTP